MSVRKSKISPKQAKLYAVLFAVAAVISLSVGIKLASDFFHLKKVCTENTVGVVTSVTKFRKGYKHNRHYEYIAYIEYSVDDTEYTCKSGSTRSMLYENSAMRVQYNPDNPSDCYTPDVLPDKGITCFVLFVIMSAISVKYFIDLKKIDDSHNLSVDT